MPYTQDEIDALMAAIARGAIKVEYADKKVEYRSLAEMRSILADMEAEVNGTTARSRRKYAAVSSGHFPTEL